MAGELFAPGSALRTFAHLATGAAAAAAENVIATPKAAALRAQHDPAAPAAAEHSGFAALSAAQSLRPRPGWPQQLLMLAAHRQAGDAAAIEALGDHLASCASVDEDIAYSHVCYTLAARTPGALGDAGTCFAGPGLLLERRRVACPDATALQALELYASCLAQALGTPPYCLAPAYVLVRA